MNTAKAFTVPVVFVVFLAIDQCCIGSSAAASSAGSEQTCKDRRECGMTDENAAALLQKQNILEKKATLTETDASLVVEDVGQEEDEADETKDAKATALMQSQAEDHHRVHEGMDAEGSEDDDLETEDYQDEEEDLEVEERLAGSGCWWSPQPKGVRQKCEISCLKSSSCFDWEEGEMRRRADGKKRGKGASGRRRCNFRIGSSCPARCSLPEHLLCGPLNTKPLGNKFCTVGCTEDNSPTWNSPKELYCERGSFNVSDGDPAAVTCMANTVRGKLAVTSINVTNIKDEDWWPDGESDPYVNVRLLSGGKDDTGRRRVVGGCRTKMRSDKTNQTWGVNSEDWEENKPCTIDVSSRASMLDLEVWDKDSWPGEDDPLSGWIRVDLRQAIETGVPLNYSFDLYQGKLEIELAYIAHS